MRITSLKKTCEAYPSQWEGKTADDRAVYIRYRCGMLVVHVSERGGTVRDAIMSEPLIEYKTGGEYDGIMTEADLDAHLVRLSFLAAKPVIIQTEHRGNNAKLWAEREK